MNCSLAIKINSEGGVTNYAYDTLSRMIGLTDFNSNPFAFSYDALGRRTSLSRPNGVSTSYQYDALSRLLSILHQSSAFNGGTSYAYDAAGNRTTRTDTFQLTGQSATATTTSYGYDQIYELTQAVVNGVTAESYAYDAVGNRVSSLGIPSYTYNSSNELTAAGPATFTYDSNGNTLTKTAPNGTTSYTWDFENRLTSVMLPKGSVLHYQYDPFGRRIESDGTGRIFVYDGDNVTEDLDLTGKVVARYAQGLGIDEPLEVFGSGASSYYEADGLGSIMSLSSASGSVANTYAYDSFGNQTASSGTVSNRFFYTGRESVAKTGLLYYRARYYDPSAGRFLSEDPLRFQSNLNFYFYDSNNPANFVDPLGFFEKQYPTTYTKVGGVGSHGDVRPHIPDLSGSCICLGHDRYKLEIKLVIPLDVTYTDLDALRHEQEHVSTLKNFFNEHSPTYEHYEETFSSLEDCERAKKLVWPNVRKQFYRDANLLNSLQEKHEDFIERLFI